MPHKTLRQVRPNAVVGALPMVGAVKNSARILVVDDEPDVRRIVCGILSETYQCTAASSAEEALSILRSEKYDLVISDIVMAGMSGLEMIPKARAIAPDTVIMMISGEQTIERAIEALRVGAFDYIRKPFDFAHVEAAVSRALEHHAMLIARHRHENRLEELVKQRTAELNHLAYHDTLTDLPNQILFQDRISQRLGMEQPSGQSLSMLLLSLDRFKKVSDTLGNALANRLLREVAERLTINVNEGDTVARFEGDEFAVLLTRIRGTEDVVETINRINEALNEPFMLDDQELYITASIGISHSPGDGRDASTLLKNAGAALYRAQELGGNNYQFYRVGISAKARQRLALENRLCQAMERKEFEVYYQPQMDTNSRQVVGMEALVRWQHPDFGLVLPAEFIPLAEDTGLIVPLGEWVLRTACVQSKAWQKAGFARLSLAVNLSARQFQQQNLSQAVIEILQETELNPHDLELEITESSIMKNADSATRTLNELKAMGVKISIDDFGTGYSSLGYLKRLPIDILKIDKSFVRDVITDPDDASLVLAIVTLAHNLRLKVVAEGVETEEQLRFLHLLRCDEWQGYLYSKPLPAGAFEELLMREQNPTFGKSTGDDVGL
jgi:diguanylate cyclase (GGDEF)-like protein